MAQVGGVNDIAYNRQWMSSMLFSQDDVDTDSVRLLYIQELKIANSNQKPHKF